jgi:UV DNA damage endonuclease
MPHQVGYCCINMTLSQSGITTGRTMRQASFQQDAGLVRTSLLTLANIQDLHKVLEWNAVNNVKLFRIGSNIFPWNSEYNITDLPDYDIIVRELRRAGDFIQQHNMRVSFHPSHFVKLASLKPIVVQRSIHDLNHHDEIFTLMGLPASHYYPLNIHVGMNYSDEVVSRFCNSFNLLNETTQKRLVVENDDKANAFSIRQLHREIYSNIHTPITFDYFHHTFHEDNITSHDAAKLAAETWDCTPLFHYSESKNLNESVQGNPRAHSDFVFTLIDDYGLNIDVDLEAKGKEFSLIKYREMQNEVV